MRVQVELATTVRIELVHLVALGPEWIVQVEVVVEAIEAHIL